MTKILVWNIEQFSINRINPIKGNKQQKEHGDYRLAHILNTLRENKPDIFSVLEVQPGAPIPNPGELVAKDGIGEQGCLYLLNAINNDPKLGVYKKIQKIWRIVPPLVSGKKGRAEAVAIFYNSTTVKFIGPEAWNGGKPYPKPWNNPVITLNTKQAARVEHSQAVKKGKAKVLVPIYFPTIDHRSPYLTTFEEKGGFKRTIELYSVHTSPAKAIQGTANIGKIVEVYSPLNKNEVRVIAGDFNVTQNENFKKKAKMKLFTFAELSYGELTALGFTQEFDAAKIIPPPDDGLGVKGHKVSKYHYVTTHIKPRSFKKVKDPDWKFQGVKKRTAAVPWGKYPSYGYMSPPPEDTLDNIFTKYPKKPGKYPANSNDRMIANRVVGAPYNLPPAKGTVAKHPPPPAKLAYPIDMKVSIPTFQNRLKGKNQAALNAEFRGFKNYGKIRLTSDHMAVYVEI